LLLKTSSPEHCRRPVGFSILLEFLHNSGEMRGAIALLHSPFDDVVDWRDLLNSSLKSVRINSRNFSELNL
jgi:hypothetical protein